MKIGIFGMGYVGVVSAACLLRSGHRVVGIDPVSSKVEALRQGQTPLHEPEVGEMLADGHARGMLSASQDPMDAVRDSDMLWVCVGTPSSPVRGADLSFVKAVVGQIGRCVK